MTNQPTFALISGSSPFIEPYVGQKFSCVRGSGTYFCLKISVAAFMEQVFIEYIVIFK